MIRWPPWGWHGGQLSQPSWVARLFSCAGRERGIAVHTMIDQLERAPMGSLHLPMPVDPRMRTIARTLSSDPANRTTIEEWARIVAMSERSLFRLIMKQTGMSFGRWRQQFQLMFAIERLTEGASVQTVSFDLGYESASAFITMFKKAMGQPPGQYLATRRSAAHPAPPEQSQPKLISTMMEVQQALGL